MSTTVTYKGATLTTATNQTRTLETAGKYMEDDVTITDVTASATLQTKTNISPTTSSQTITADSGYDGLSSVQINAMPSGSVTVSDTFSGTGTLTAEPPATAEGTLGVLRLNRTINVTPTVTTAGYVTNGTEGTLDVTLSKIVSMRNRLTFTPSTVNQSINSDTYLYGGATILGDGNLTAGNIKKDVSIFNVVGTYEGGGASSDITVTISALQNGYLSKFLPPSASATTDPDQPWLEYITIPANSMICLQFQSNPSAYLDVSGATYSSIAGAVSRGFYFVFVFLGTTDATVFC